MPSHPPPATLLTRGSPRPLFAASCCVGADPEHRSWSGEGLASRRGDTSLNLPLRRDGSPRPNVGAGSFLVREFFTLIHARILRSFCHRYNAKLLTTFAEENLALCRKDAQSVQPMTRLTRAIGMLTFAAACAATGLSENHLRKCTDPASGRDISLRAAIKIDQALVAQDDEPVMVDTFAASNAKSFTALSHLRRGLSELDQAKRLLESGENGDWQDSMPSRAS